jgi:hypothetical protein
MSKIVYICARHGVAMPFTSDDIELISVRITPDNIQPRPPLITENKGALIAVINPVDTLPVKETSVCLGNLIDAKKDWWIPGADVPDGTYALFRGSNTTVEVVSDFVASRTVWYVKTELLFIASTSQRAIVMLLKSFEPNEYVNAWMLSSGTLGLGYSWDKRISCLPRNAKLVLDKPSWELKVHTEPLIFKRQDAPASRHYELLENAVVDTFSHLDLDLERWVLPLSGGYDSRAILMMLKDHSGLKTITWGSEEALNDPLSDACVAEELAQYYGLTNEYFKINLSGENVEKIFHRFFVAGEGRTDHISGYMDGLVIWKHLHDSGCEGVIRGDEAFGWSPVYSTSDVMRTVGILLLEDYSDTANILGDAMNQIIPETLERAEGETLETWRDRLYLEFRCSLVLASLNDIKCSYVEIANPLQSRRILEGVIRLPDSLRTGKKLFRKFVKLNGPPVRFAERPAIQMPSSILRDSRVIEPIIDELQSVHARGLFSNQLLEFVALNASRSIETSGQTSFKGRIKNILPNRLKASMKYIFSKNRRNPSSIKLDCNRLAFRAYCISKMHSLLKEDSKILV